MAHGTATFPAFRDGGREGNGRCPNRRWEDRNLNNKRIDWRGVKTAYVTGDKSYAALALEMNISPGSIALRARKEKWGEARAAFRDSVVKKVVEAHADKEAEGLKKLLDAAEHMAGALSEALRDKDQLLHSIAQIDDERGEGEKLDTRAIRNLTGALNDMAQLLRGLYRLPTPAEEERLKLAREKFEFEKAKTAALDDREVTVSLGEAEAYAR